MKAWLITWEGLGTVRREDRVVAILSSRWSIAKIQEHVEFLYAYLTGEHGTFDRIQLDQLLELAISGIRSLDAAQTKALSE